MADEVNTAHCPFDKLFTRNVPHILENIFFSLDYESFKTCMEVNKGWHELLTSRFYNKKALLVFGEGISEDENKLLKASRDGNASLVRGLLSSGLINVDCVPFKALSTPLLLAAWKGHREVTKVLLDRGADPNKADKFGMLPLHEAATKGHGDVAELLIARGSNVNTEDKFGRTPLLNAACHGHKIVVKLLLEGGVNPNQPDVGGWTPSLYHIRQGYNRAAQPTPLQYAASRSSNEYKDVVKLLLQYGADPRVYCYPKRKRSDWLLLIQKKN